MVYLGEYSLCTEKNVYYAVAERRVLYMFVRLDLSTMLFKCTLFLLLFHLVILSILESGVLKSLTITVLKSCFFLI